MLSNPLFPSIIFLVPNPVKIFAPSPYTHLTFETQVRCQLLCSISQHRSVLCQLGVYINIHTMFFVFQSHYNLQSGITQVNSQLRRDLLVTIIIPLCVTFRLNTCQRLTGVIMSIFVKMNYFLFSHYMFRLLTCAYWFLHHDVVLIFEMHDSWKMYVYK